MGQCYITRRGTKTGGAVEQLGIYPTGNDGRPMGNVTVLDNVTTLSKYPFIENDNVLTIALPENLRNLADYCFQKCTGLQNISIPNKVVSISQYCFDGCTSLSKVILSKSLTSIGQYAFQNCSNLYDIVIPNEIESLQINRYAFSGCSLDNEAVSKLASLCSGTIYSYAFANITSITEITASYVANYYFSGCTNLKKATILNPLKSGNFGRYVFENCSNLTTVILPNNATKLDDYMFYENTNLTNVNIPTSLISIGLSAFNGCTKLTSISIPDNVTTIGDKAFYNCTNLTSVIVSENANYTLGQHAFQSTGVTDACVADIMSHASSVESYIFDKCNSLENVEVKYFGTNMFSNCTNLKTAKSTGTGSSTGNSVFQNDIALETVIFSDETTTIGTKVFYGCTSLKTVYLPSSIITATNSSLTSTSSSYYAFYNCTALENVQLGQDWNMSLRLNVSNNLTVDSMVAMFNSLKDLTGDTAKTLTLGSTNLAKLTDEQKLIATNKNWTLA